MSRAEPIGPKVMRSPRERWGTCCPFDPECDHSYIEDADELTRWMDKPISDEDALMIEHAFYPNDSDA